MRVFSDYTLAENFSFIDGLKEDVLTNNATLREYKDYSHSLKVHVKRLRLDNKISSEEAVWREKVLDDNFYYLITHLQQD